MERYCWYAVWANSQLLALMQLIQDSMSARIDVESKKDSFISSLSKIYTVKSFLALQSFHLV